MLIDGSLMANWCSIMANSLVQLVTSGDNGRIQNVMMARIG